MARVLSVNRSVERGKSKIPTRSATLYEGYGIEGDAHAGPWHRQVSLLAWESVEKMMARGAGGLTPGTFAENITTQGLPLREWTVGDRLRVGPCLLRITQIGKVCHRDCAVFRRLGECAMPQEGLFAEVLSGGVVRPGDEIDVIPVQDNCSAMARAR